MHLSCIVVGGKPPPRVVWYKNSQLFSEQAVRREDTSTGQLVTYNNLTIIAIPRSAQARTYLPSRSRVRSIWYLTFLQQSVQQPHHFTRTHNH